MTLKELFEQYRQSSNAKEHTTRYTEKIHIAHLQPLLGARQNVPGL